MRRGLIAFLLGCFVGSSFGVAVGFFLFPFVFPAPPAQEQLTESEANSEVLAAGTFIHANPSDPIHWGKGRVTVRATSLFLEDDFEVGPGPAYHVFLVPKATIRASDDVKEQMYVDLGGLRAFKGSQRYAIPNGVDISKYASVVIWCREFSVLISPADLTSKR